MKNLAASRPAGRPAIVQVVLTLGRGGLETMAVDLACGLASAGMRPIVVALDEGGDLEERLREAEIEYVVLGGRRFFDARFHLTFANLLRDWSARVVHTHMFASLLHSLPAIALSGVKRVVHTEHSFEYLQPRPSLRVALRWMSRRTDVFALVGHRMLPYYKREVKIASRRLRVIPNGIDTRHPVREGARTEVRREMGLPADTLLIGSAGRLAPEKNYQLLLRAVAGCRREGTATHLVLLGEGELRTDLEQLADSLGIADAVTFMGWRSDVRYVLHALDVFALTSISEGLPLAMLEAMAAELPVVSTEVGDIPLLVQDGETGFLVRSGDELGLTVRLRQLAASPPLRRALGLAGRERVRSNYDRACMVRHYVDAYAV